MKSDRRWVRRALDLLAFGSVLGLVLLGLLRVTGRRAETAPPSLDAPSTTRGRPDAGAPAPLAGSVADTPRPPSEVAPQSDPSPAPPRATEPAGASSRAEGRPSVRAEEGGASVRAEAGRPSVRAGERRLGVWAEAGGASVRAAGGASVRAEGGATRPEAARPSIRAERGASVRTEAGRPSVRAEAGGASVRPEAGGASVWAEAGGASVDARPARPPLLPGAAPDGAPPAAPREGRSGPSTLEALVDALGGRLADPCVGPRIRSVYLDAHRSLELDEPHDMTVDLLAEGRRALDEALEACGPAER